MRGTSLRVAREARTKKRAEAACEKTCWRGARGRRRAEKRTLLERRTCSGEAHVAEDVLRGARVEKAQV